MTRDPREEFAEALRQAGLRLDGLPEMDGQLRRVTVEGDRGGERSGAYVGFGDGHPAGYIKNFRAGIDTSWKSQARAGSLGAEDHARLVAEAAQRRQERAKETEARHERAAAEAEQRWSTAAEASPDHPYLAAKGVPASGIRQDADGNLLVPLRDIDGRLQTTQTLGSDGRKSFQKDGKVKGGHLMLGDPVQSEIILVAEGYATAAELHRATGLAVAAAMNAGNLTAVAQAYRERYPGKVIGIGAISDLKLHDATDRISFSADEAVSWLKRPDIIGGYIVELFRFRQGQAPDAISILVQRFRTALATLPSGVSVRTFQPIDTAVGHGEQPLVITIQLLKNPRRKEIALPAPGMGQAIAISKARSSIAIADRDLSPAHHQALLDLLAEQTIVRNVDLPPLIEAAPAARPTSRERPAVPVPAPNGRYPVVGIIDGGVASIPDLLPWRAGDAGVVTPGDRDERHGTFIAGLVVAGATFNPHINGWIESQNCKYFDLDIFPRAELRHQYYGGDIDYFFDLLDEKIKVAKRDHRVRVFNLSFGLRTPNLRYGYTPVADRLDRLARASLTLAYTPPIDPDHKDEAQRVQLEAHLHQEKISPQTGEIEWESQLTADGSKIPQGMNKTERYLLMTGTKWSPIKRYYANMTQGRGDSSNWKLSLDSLTRAGAAYPQNGVPFAIIMTISDQKRNTPIHDSVRNTLLNQGLSIADIMVAHRIRPRADR